MPFSSVSANTSVFQWVRGRAPIWGCSLGPPRAVSQGSIKGLHELPAGLTDTVYLLLSHQPDLIRDIHRELAVLSHCVVL